jgi:hypothetical protein
MSALASRAVAAGMLEYFLTAICPRGPQESVQPSTLHGAYIAFCAERSQRPLTLEQFMEECARLLPGARGRVWRGIGLPA